MNRSITRFGAAACCVGGLAAVLLMSSVPVDAGTALGNGGVASGVAAVLEVLGGNPVADCNNNGIDDSDELSTNDCNSNGIPDDCDLGIGLKDTPVPDNVAIPDNDSVGVSSMTTVSESGVIADLDLGLTITHTWNGDLIVRLSHGGTTVTVIDRPGHEGSGFGFSNDGFDVVLDDAAAQPIETFNSGGPMVTGRFSPNEPLSAFNGMDKTGDWELFVSDNAMGDTGTLTLWTLFFANDVGDATSEDCNFNHIPDECEDDCNANGIADECDLRDGTSQDCNLNDIPDECDIAALDSPDCQPNGIPDECELKDGDCNQNETPDNCETDCNGNEVADDCDVNGIEATFYEDLWPLEDDTQKPVVRGVGPGGNVADDLHFAGPGMMTGFAFGYVNFSSLTEPATIEFYSNNPTADPNSDFSFIAGYEFNLTPSNGTTVFHDGFMPVALPQDVWMALRTQVPVARGFGVRPLISTSMPTAGTSLDLLYDFNSDTLFDFGGDPLANLVLAVYGITAPTSEDCQPNGIPDECEEDCNSNGLPDDCEDFCNDDRSRGDCIPDCNDNGIPDSCEAPDCNDNDVPDECDICPDPRGGCSQDCNDNGIPDECEELEDCDGNDTPDVCQLFLDCNDNGIPDQCEELPDCNHNFVPDECEICNGDALRGDECAEDCNGNEVPDECDPDCNLNDIPDDCEDLPDCNGNEVPDTCDVNGIEEAKYEDLVPLPIRTVRGDEERAVADDLHFAASGPMTSFSFGYVNFSTQTIPATIAFYTNNASADPNSDFVFITGFEFDLTPTPPTIVHHDGFAPVDLPMDVWMEFRVESPLPPERGIPAGPLVSNSMPTAGTSLDLIYDFGLGTTTNFGGDPKANLVLAVYGPGQPGSADCNGNGVPDECEPDCNGNAIPDACDGGCPPEQEQPMDDFMTDFKTDTTQPGPCGDCGGMDPLWFLLSVTGYAGLLFVRRRVR